MSFLKRIFRNKYETQCLDCSLMTSCLCATCESVDCRDGMDCKKEQPITYCQCKECDGERCSTCKPDIH